MNEIEKNIAEITKNTILMDFLGAENVEDMKKRIVDVIVNEVDREIESSYDYILNLDAIIDEITNEVQAELKPIIKEKVFAKTMKELRLE